MSASAEQRLLDLRPLAHPGWWLAAAVLYVNDNFLKGRGVVPGWLTGKLSDFAFLIVAPVLLGSLLPLAVPRRKELALAAVGGLFVATELSPSVADAVVAIAARLGMRWRLWPDLTDLVALVVLPFSWRLLDRPRQDARPLRSIGVIVGLHLCLATTEERAPQYPFLVNRSSGTAPLRLTRLLPNACKTDLAAFAARLSLGDLGAVDQFTLEPGEVAALDHQAPEGHSSALTCQNDPASQTGGPCSVLLVDVPGGPAVLVRTQPAWSAASEDTGFFCASPPQASRCQPRMDPGPDPGPGALSLLVINGQLGFRAAPGLETVEVSRAEIEARGVPPDSCLGLRQQADRLVANATGTCSDDRDCQPAVRPVPSRTAPCFLYTDAASAALLGELRRKGVEQQCSWAIAATGSCPNPSFGACRGGRCFASCPGQPCAHRCLPSQAPALECTNEGDVCVESDSEACTCRIKRWTCGEPTSLGICAVPCAGGLGDAAPDGAGDAGEDGAVDGSGPDAAAD